MELSITLIKKVINPQGKRTREKEKSREELQKQSGNNEQNGNKYKPINNYFKYKWTISSNKKTESD